MSFTRILTVGVAGAMLAACSSDGITPTPPATPTAAVRFVNALPDTNALDLRFVDIVQNAPTFGVAFRTVTPYQPVEAGTRALRIFLSSSNPAVASQVLFDQSVAFEAGKQYTIIAQGFARSGQSPARTLRVVEDVPPTPAAGSIAVRVYHLGAGVGPIDAYLSNFTTTAGIPAISGTPDAANIAYGGASTYIARTATATADSLLLRVTATGTTTPVLVTARAPVGVAGTTTANPVPGARIAGSVLSAFVFGPSVAGSQAASFTTAGAAINFEKRPPNTAP